MQGARRKIKKERPAKGALGLDRISVPLDVVVVGTECPDSPRDFAALSVREDAPQVIGIVGIPCQHSE